MPKYPEHEKLKAKEHESHVLSGFLDMLDERRLVLAHYHTHEDSCYDGEGDLECELGVKRLNVYGIPTKEQLIGFYLEIDPKKLSAEKDAMYRELIAHTAPSRDLEEFVEGEKVMSSTITKAEIEAERKRIDDALFKVNKEIATRVAERTRLDEERLHNMRLMNEFLAGELEALRKLAGES